MFEFEHIIRLTNPGDETKLSKEKLWERLCDFARHPENYVEDMTRSEVFNEKLSDTGSDEFERLTFFGAHEIHEKVSFNKESSVSFVLQRINKEKRDSFFSIKIEEPEVGVLFLRFTYKAPETKEDKIYPQIAELKRQAYQQKDMDIVKKILG